MRTPLLAAALAVLAAAPAPAARHDAEKLPVTRIRDLHYGDALFYFYQDEEFEALTRLLAYEHWNRVPHHLDEAQLLEGGLYLSLGMHNEAGERFARLLTDEVPTGVRNRAWFYLAQVWYARGYLEKADAVLRKVNGRMSPELEAQKELLFGNVLMHEGRYDEAIRMLSLWRDPEGGRRIWSGYARFNLGVALVRNGRLADADPFLTAVGSMIATTPELLALKDRASLALGFAYLRAHRRGHCAHPQRRNAPARADERSGRALWLVLAAEEPPRRARVTLPVRGAGRTRLPGGTEELPRPAVPERRARTLGREHGRLRGHDRDARARLRRAAAACGRVAHLGRRAEAAAAQHRPRERTARHRDRGRHVRARHRRRARAVGARQARGGRSRRRAGDARVRRPPRAAGAGEGRAAVRPQRRVQGAALAGAPRAERPQPRAARGAEPLDPRGARSPQRTDQHRRVRRARHLAQAAHRRPADASRRGRAQAGRVPRARRGPSARGAERPAGDLPGAGALCARHHVRPRRERPTRPHPGTGGDAR